jgi:uncharacterized Zn finger protein
MPRRAQWKPYVAQTTRKAAAAREGNAAAKRGEAWSPVQPDTSGRKITTTVWGAAWCANLERYRDFENRLPRGRTYVRNGSVVHLAIEPGRIEARVSGSDMYRVEIRITEVDGARWTSITKACGADIGSVIEVLEGRLSAAVMAVMTAPGTGLFPEPSEISMTCSCPDWATMCKHVAAVMYGVGVRLDGAPALLFALRGVDPSALVGTGVRGIVAGARDESVLDDGDLSAIFGIDVAVAVAVAVDVVAAPKKKAAKKKQKTATQRSARAR